MQHFTQHAARQFTVCWQATQHGWSKDKTFQPTFFRAGFVGPRKLQLWSTNLLNHIAGADPENILTTAPISASIGNIDFIT